nr:atp-dependent zinc metalloprotease ftsh 12, chloroplastic [Quercus suber]
MAESDSVGPEWLEAVMVKTRRVREEGNWVCLEDANVKVGEFVGRAKEGVSKGQGEFVGRAKEGVSKGQGELEQFRTELVPEFVSWNQWERWKVISAL